MLACVNGWCVVTVACVSRNIIVFLIHKIYTFILFLPFKIIEIFLNFSLLFFLHRQSSTLELIIVIKMSVANYTD